MDPSARMHWQHRAGVSPSRRSLSPPPVDRHTRTAPLTRTPGVEHPGSYPVVRAVPRQTPPPRHNAAPASPPRGQQDWYSLYREFYAIHNPAKLVDLPALMERFRGREEQMWYPLLRKYGVTEQNWRAPLRGVAGTPAPPPPPAMAPPLRQHVASPRPSTPAPAQQSPAQPANVLGRATMTEEYRGALTGNLAGATSRLLRRRDFDRWVAFVLWRRKSRRVTRICGAWSEVAQVRLAARYWHTLRRYPLIRHRLPPREFEPAAAAPSLSVAPVEAGSGPVAAGHSEALRMHSSASLASRASADAWRSRSRASISRVASAQPSPVDELTLRESAHYVV
eukprot:TRINITY_DN13704_c0_g1_i2.p1 TRINITY_DN13704_c0_g1~~TRINITY_DN13704_c0_g1_i2.p1  ORF type:complete len:356 (+),score=53.87 TRINITY_DN13704_c0_g1_i2:58-1068(+)